jgi:hypothetical protein
MNQLAMRKRKTAPAFGLPCSYPGVINALRVPRRCKRSGVMATDRAPVTWALKSSLRAEVGGGAMIDSEHQQIRLVAVSSSNVVVGGNSTPFGPNPWSVNTCPRVWAWPRCSTAVIVEYRATRHIEPIRPGNCGGGAVPDPGIVGIRERSHLPR